jgi:hypothetical protein
MRHFRARPVAISEPALNVILAQLLEKRGLRAIGEVISHQSGYRPDVLMTINGVKVILEGRFQAPGVEASLDDTCQGRIENNLCDLCIAVVYPKPEPAQLSLSSKDAEGFLLKSTYKAKVYTIGSSGIREWDWEGDLDINGLANLIRASYNQVISEDRVTDTVGHLGEALNSFAELVLSSGPEQGALAERARAAMDLPAELPEREAEEEE